MNESKTVISRRSGKSNFTPTIGVLQHKCACGRPSNLAVSCSGCEKARMLGHPWHTKSINGPGDVYESEADRWVEKDMRMLAPEKNRGQKKAPVSPFVQRSTNVNGAGIGVPPMVYHTLSSPGQPLDTETRAYFEPRFRRDLKHIRIHTDAAAAASAGAVGAVAYAAGNSIVSARGNISTANPAGRYLLAHELAHTLQEPPPADAPFKSSRENPAEREANAIARQLSRSLRLEAETPAIPRARRSASIHLLDAAQLQVQVDEEFAAELMALDRMLQGSVNKRDVSSILAILRDWAVPEVIADGWHRLGERPLNKFLRKLSAADFAVYPLEILASIAALPEGDHAERTRRLSSVKLGQVSIKKASLAYFHVLAIAPEELGTVARSEQQESRFAERIKALLPREVRIALLKAMVLAESAESSGEPTRQPSPPTGEGDPAPSLLPSPAAATLMSELDDFLHDRYSDSYSPTLALQRFGALATLQSEGAAGNGDVFRATVLRAEQLGLLSPWLERLFAADDSLLTQVANREALRAIFRARPLSLLRPHLLKLLKADRPAKKVKSSDARLAQAIVDARPAEERTLLRDMLRSYPSADLEARLPVDTQVVLARQRIEADPWLRVLTEAADNLLSDGADQGQGREPWDIMDRLVGAADRNESTESSPPSTGLPYRPPGRDLRADVAVFDAAGLVDLLLDRAFKDDKPSGVLPAQITLPLVKVRAIDANIRTVRRLLGSRRLSGAQAAFVYQIVTVLPAEDLHKLYRSEPNLDAAFKKALPSFVRDASFGPDLRLGHTVEALIETLDDENLWPPAPGPDEEIIDKRLHFPPVTRSLLRALVQAGTPVQAEMVCRRHGWTLEQAGIYVQHAYQDTEDEQSEHIVVVDSDKAGFLERLLRLATKSYADWIDLHNEGPWRGKLNDLFDVVVFGIGLKRRVEIAGPAFDIAQIDALLEGMVIRIDGGNVGSWQAKVYTDEHGRGERFELKDSTVELAGFFFGMEGVSIAVDRISLTDLNVKGDMVIARGASRIGQLFSGIGLLYAIQDGMRSIADLVIQALIRQGPPPSALVTASDMLARPQSRFFTHLIARSVEVKGLVVAARSNQTAAVFSTDILQIGVSNSPWPAFVIHSDHGAENWPRLLELRGKRDRGRLDDSERLELAQLEEDALELVMSTEASRVSIQGLDLLVTESEKRVFKTEVERINAHRIYLQADIDATSEAAGLKAYDFDRSGTASPLEILRATGDGSAQARLLQFHAIITGLQTTLPVAQPDKPLVGGLVFQSPLGDLELAADVADAQQLVLSILQDRFVTEEPAHSSFPEPLPGDRLISAEGLEIRGVRLMIQRTDKLLAAWFNGAETSDSASETNPHELVDFLRDLSGTVTLSIHAADPRGEGTLEGQVIQVELEHGGGLRLNVIGQDVPPWLLSDVDDIADLIDIIAEILTVYDQAGEYLDHLARDLGLNNPEPAPEEEALEAEQAQAEADAQRDALRVSLEEAAVDVSVEGIRLWLERNTNAFVEVQGTALHWRPAGYDFGAGGNVMLSWGQSSGVPLRIGSLVGLPGTAGIVSLEVQPFFLPAIHGYRGDVHFAAESLEFAGPAVASVRLLGYVPDHLEFSLAEASLGKLWVLARGISPSQSQE